MKRAGLGALLALTIFLAACTNGRGNSPPKSAPSAPAAVRDTVRVGVFMAPDPTASTYGAAATRSLIYPQLFRATPAGRWTAGVVAPGSDRTAPDAQSARFRLRANARWSDGTPISAADLRRTADSRFVKAVDDATTRGTIVVHFTQALPGWRRLWSGLDTIAPPNAGVFGGPYTLAGQTPGLEAVLTRNARYYGPRPAIREVHLVFAPDPEIAARLMDRGELDVIAPLAFSVRTERLRKINDAQVLLGSASRGGWTAALVANPSRLSKDRRAAVFALVDRKRFTDVILHAEATAAGPSTASEIRGPLTGAVPSISAPVEEPHLALLLQAMQRLARDRGIALELRQTDFDQVLRSYAASDFDVLVRIQPTTPERCWVCEAASVNPSLAAAADSGDNKAVEQLN
nr:hypothetical protein [Actinomycetota bacterium]